MAKKQDTDSRLFKSITAFLKSFSNYTFKGFAANGDSAPGSPLEHDAYLVTEDGTIFGVAGVTENQFLVYKGASWEAETIWAETKESWLLRNDIPNSEQIISLDEQERVSLITHKVSGNTLRTDSFSYSETEIIETRHLDTGESIIFTFNLTTKTTTIS